MTALPDPGLMARVRRDLRLCRPVAGSDEHVVAGCGLRSPRLAARSVRPSGARQVSDRRGMNSRGQPSFRLARDTAGADLDRLGLDPLETVISQLYRANHVPLVRLAVALVRDHAMGEEIVQDAFVALHLAWPRLRDAGKALSYLRRSVVNASRSALRHRLVADKHAPVLVPYAPGADHAVIAIAERSAVLGALRRLPARQREVLVLRYYCDLSEAEIARAMSISQGAVKSHTARGISALRQILRDGG